MAVKTRLNWKWQVHGGVLRIQGFNNVTAVNQHRHSYGSSALTLRVCGAADDVVKFGLETGVGDAVFAGGLEASGP